ncbi:nucleoside triphosphate pyrophosphohydrolase [Martelella alba]|uniref:Nucleoside triphosphate pyrophosphohydrolase n=1 Tax=Martelella alba TaxID=2590451 RepID=A0ABY2SWB8_9HYPH|nr:nucleoside triphosphate pyrophosphohydrolase [Martelella alba]TKI08827.1 nucleoside triphosphate pyrophosphohydrolase [Martelella alba]
MSDPFSAQQRLLDIMTRLRDPRTGCPWDRRQTFDSIAPYTLEETYEVLDAIARRDYDDLRGELGDLLFQVVFYAELAREQGLFSFADICQAISDKLERRHPHIFPDPQGRLAAPAPGQWESLKARERAEKSRPSPLDDIPETLPALMKAQKIQQRCASVGFDWTRLEPVVDKVREEIDEVLQEVRRPQIDEDKLEEELGDLLFATVNLTRHLGKKAETALQKANRKFAERFRQVEALLKADGLDLPEASLEQMEDAWRQVKLRERDR